MSIAVNQDNEKFIEKMEKDYKLELLQSKEEIDSDSELSEGGIKIQNEIDKMTGGNL